MGYSGGSPEQYRHVEALGYVVCGTHEIKALLRIRRLHHGDFGGLCIVPVVLLILR